MKWFFYLIYSSVYPLRFFSSSIIALKKWFFYLIYSYIYPLEIFLLSYPLLLLKRGWNNFSIWSSHLFIFEIFLFCYFSVEEITFLSDLFYLSMPANFYSLFLLRVDDLIFESNLFIYLPLRFSFSAFIA